MDLDAEKAHYLASIYEKAGYSVLLTSAQEATGTEVLKEALVDNAKDEKGYLSMNYVGKRENGNQTYQGGFKYFTNEEKEYFKLKGEEIVEMEYATEEDVDYKTVEIIKDSDNDQDIFVLPATTFALVLSSTMLLFSGVVSETTIGICSSSKICSESIT